MREGQPKNIQLSLIYNDNYFYDLKSTAKNTVNFFGWALDKYSLTTILMENAKWKIQQRQQMKPIRQ